MKPLATKKRGMNGESLPCVKSKAEKTGARLHFSLRKGLRALGIASTYKSTPRGEWLGIANTAAKNAQSEKPSFRESNLGTDT